MTPVSLVITSYNREQYLAAAIESILSQTYENFELLIWDDGSEDNSLQLAQQYADIDTRIQVKAASHQGLSQSLHDAVAATNHPYLGWVDSDDKLAPTALAETVSILDAQPNTGLVYTNYHNINAEGNVTGLGERCCTPYSLRRLLVSFMTFHFRLIRRSVYNQSGGINPTFERAEDYDLCLRLSEITHIEHLKRPLYFYRQHDSNVTNNEIEMLRWTYQASQSALQRRGMSDQYEIKLSSVLALRRKPDTLPLVSIIITAYNSASTLERCLQSCFTQSYSNIEVIVVDNNSTDETPALLERSNNQAPCPFLSLQCTEQGQNYAQNYGFSYAKGDYIQWLDSDDELEPRKIAKQVSALEDNRTFDIAYGNWQWCFHQPEQATRRLSFVGRQYDDILLQLLMDNWRPPNTYLLRRSAAAHLQTLSAWNPSTTACTDREYYTLAAIEGFRFLYVPDAGVCYNSGLSTQVTHSTPYLKRVKNLTQMFERFQHRVRQNSKVSLDATHHFLLSQNWKLWKPAFSLVNAGEASCWIQHKTTGQQAQFRQRDAKIIRAWFSLAGAYTLEDHARRIVRQLWHDTMLRIGQAQGKEAALDQALVNTVLMNAVGLESPNSEFLATDCLQAAISEPEDSRLKATISNIVQRCPLYAPMFSEQRLRVHSVLERLRQQGWLELHSDAGKA